MALQKKNTRLPAVKDIPVSSGVYIMRDHRSEIIYIGKALNLKKRISSYLASNVSGKAALIRGSLRHIDYVLASSEREALILERQLINKFKPYYNSMWRDDKSYPFIKMTLKEDFPRVFLTRKKTDDGSLYFGPYPNVYPIKHLLRSVQKVFRWRPCKLGFTESSLPRPSKVKSCLYYHTGRCDGPCMGKISSKKYKENVRELRSFLKANFGRLKEKWRAKMEAASARLEYEKARDLLYRIRALEYIEQKVSVSEIKQAELESSLMRTDALEEIKKVLGLSSWPVVIEGFDISHTSGTEAVGSMVSFENGSPDKKGYRKFKIRTVKGIDDPEMIAEVVTRRYGRLKREKMKMPGLVLIDGGKTQLRAAAKALGTLGLKIPLVSLAKKEEELFTLAKNMPIKLPRNSGALRILQAVRDEAHRFAVSYHHQRRNRNFIKRRRRLL